MHTLTRFWIAFLSILTLGLPQASLAQNDDLVAELYSKEGSVQAKLANQNDWNEVERGVAFHAGDTVRVSSDGRAGISFKTGSYLRLSNNALLRFDSADQSPQVALDSGKGYFFSREPLAHPEVKTPIVSAAIRGTEFVVETKPDQVLISVIDGEVEAHNQYGNARVSKGQQASTDLGKAPVVRVLVNPADAVQWALRYPAVTAFEHSSPSSPHEQSVMNLIQQSQTLLGSGQYEKSRVLLAEAQNKLTLVGATNAAQMKAIILSQEAIIAVVQNHKDQALSVAKQAQQSSPESLSAALALSYAYQAQFDLDQARSVLESFMETHQAHAFLLARLAELALGFGEIEKADDLLSKSLKLDSQDAYSQALVGFVAIFKNELDSAEQAFQKSIALDSGYGLPHLGQALVLMRRGHAQISIEEFKRAVALEPSVALYRSYLGKAFYEEEQEDLAAHEYNIAIDQDEKDPTPWLYRAFNQLSHNNVVPALKDVEASIERNDNRAVYRSRLLLDQDSGVRSAGLARVFNDLGFSEVARIEAIKSINSDYTNYSAHRLLADASNSIFLADASFSENRIANLLAPLSLNLFQSVGGEASLNDYNALFDKAEQRTGAGFTYDGRDDIYAGNLFTAGRTEKAGYFMGLESGFADGSRHNNYLNDYRLSLAGQYQATWQDRFILETQGQFRDVKDEGGSPQESEFRSGNVSLGYNRRISAGNTLIAQAAIRRGSTDTRDHLIDNAIIDQLTSSGEDSFSDDLSLRDNTKEDVTSVRTGSQYLLSSALISSVTGFQFYYQNADRKQNALVIDDSEGIFSGLGRHVYSNGDNNISSEDFYTYTTVHATRWADINVGATYSTVETEKREITPFVNDTITNTRLNPKIGLTLYPLTNLTLRTAYFETLRKSALEDQDSLEPTIVGGLNQRFTDFSGAEARNLGFGADYKIPGWSYFGAQWTRRHIINHNAGADLLFNFDFVDQTENQTALSDAAYDEHVKQDVVGAYYYQVLSERIVTTFDYQFTQQRDTDPEVFQELENHRIVIGTRYFDPSGVFVFGRGTWREQHRDQSFFYEDGVEDFWVIDAGLGYRIPKRHGTITLEFLNLANQDFQYDQSLGFEPFIKPEFSVLLAFTTNF